MRKKKIFVPLSADDFRNFGKNIRKREHGIPGYAAMAWWASKIFVIISAKRSVHRCTLELVPVRVVNFFVEDSDQFITHNSSFLFRNK